MASHFQWYPSSEEVIVPFNARYSFPTQANKAVKVTPRVPPISGTTFTPTGGPIRITLPAQGYMNPRNSTLEFDVTLTTGTDSTVGNAAEMLRFQNNIQSIFSRARLLYGSTPLEDIGDYNVIVRALTEWTCTNQNGTLDSVSINEGIGGVAFGVNAAGSGEVGTKGVRLGVTPIPPHSGASATYQAHEADYAMYQQKIVNVRQKYIQGSSYPYQRAAASAETFGYGTVPVGGNTSTSAAGATYSVTRRYQIQLAFGLFNQEKLIPLKWMASQLTLELTLAPPASCLFQMMSYGQTQTTTPTYSVSNVNFIPEILEFDASYDAMFLKGLREGGVPIKFSTWHTYTYSIGGLNTVNFIIPEKSRSIKSIFVLQRRGTDTISTDSGASFFCSGTSMTVADGSGAINGGSLQTYQFRIGGRYFPAAPVQCSTTLSSGITNGGAEAFIEHQKALNQMGDYRLSVPLNTLRWAVPNALTAAGTTLGGASNTNGAHAAMIINEGDFSGGEILSFDSSGRPSTGALYGQSVSLVGSTQFSCSIDLETASGVEIAGLNAEEQSDISFIALYSNNQATNNVLEAFVYYDAMIVLRENNVLELIQ